MLQRLDLNHNSIKRYANTENTISMVAPELKYVDLSHNILVQMGIKKECPAIEHFELR